MPPRPMANGRANTAPSIENNVQAAFPLPKSSLHFYGNPIDSEHDDDYPAGSGFVL